MATMNISLPDTMKAFVDERLEIDGYGSVSEYVRELIRNDQKRRDAEKLEKLLLQRLESTAEFGLDEVKNELVRRINEKRNK